MDTLTLTIEEAKKLKIRDVRESDILPNMDIGNGVPFLPNCSDDIKNMKMNDFSVFKQIAAEYKTKKIL